MNRMLKLNPIQIQQEYIDTVQSAYLRWGHRKGIKNIADGVGGHYGRTVRKASEKAISALMSWGYNESMATFLIHEAHDVVLLERSAE